MTNGYCMEQIICCIKMEISSTQILASSYFEMECDSGHDAGKNGQVDNRAMLLIHWQCCADVFEMASEKSISGGTL